MCFWGFVFWIKVQHKYFDFQILLFLIFCLSDDESCQRGTWPLVKGQLIGFTSESVLPVVYTRLGCWWEKSRSSTVKSYGKLLTSWVTLKVTGSVLSLSPCLNSKLHWSSRLKHHSFAQHFDLMSFSSSLFVSVVSPERFFPLSLRFAFRTHWSKLTYLGPGWYLSRSKEPQSAVFLKRSSR